MSKGITLLTMGAGNILVLKETLKSFVGSGICNEVIYGDMLLFPDDREVVKTYEKEFNLKSIKLPFDYIFKNGFSSILNLLADHAINDLVIYMNTSEIIGVDNDMEQIINDNPDCNTFYFGHSQEIHRWFRCYNRNELKWSGRIHEELQGEYRPYHKPIFIMEDLEKDMGDSLKAKILNDCKEIVYFQQYISIVDNPKLLAGTNVGWLTFSIDGYESFKYRLDKKGKRYEAFLEGDLEKYMNDVMTNPEFEKEMFESNFMIAFQGDKIHLL